MKIISKLLNLILIIIALIFAYKIFLFKDFDNKNINEIFNVMSNHINIVSKDKSVATTNTFIKLKKHTYTNESYTIFSPTKATVIDTTSSSILLKTASGYHIYFENLINIDVSKYDVVDDNDVLAYFIDYFYCYFIKNEMNITYEEFMENN